MILMISDYITQAIICNEFRYCFENGTVMFRDSICAIS